jgi:hypothetical protein
MRQELERMITNADRVPFPQLSPGRDLDAVDFSSITTFQVFYEVTARLFNNFRMMATDRPIIEHDLRTGVATQNRPVRTERNNLSD